MSTIRNKICTYKVFNGTNKMTGEKTYVEYRLEEHIPGGSWSDCADSRLLLFYPKNNSVVFWTRYDSDRDLYVSEGTFNFACPQAYYFSYADARADTLVWLDTAVNAMNQHVEKFEQEMGTYEELSRSGNKTVLQ